MESTRRHRPGLPESFELKAFELNLLLLESVALGAFLLTGTWWVVRRLLHAPDALGVGTGFLVAGWALYPALSAYSRSVGKQMRFLRFAIASIVGAVVGGALFALLL